MLSEFDARKDDRTQAASIHWGDDDVPVDTALADGVVIADVFEGELPVVEVTVRELLLAIDVMELAGDGATADHCEVCVGPDAVVAKAEDGGAVEGNVKQASKAINTAAHVVVK